MTTNLYLDDDFHEHQKYFVSYLRHLVINIPRVLMNMSLQIIIQRRVDVSERSVR